MGLKIKIDPVERATVATVRADLSLPEQKQAAAQFVREGIREADTTNRLILGRVPPRTITVDGRQGAPIESVDPQRGSVIVEYELIADVLRWIARELVLRSPIRSGAYAKGHTLFADGVEVPAAGAVPVAEEYTFINPVPYARKIEIGKTKSGRSFVVQVPNRIYERTAKDARSRFGNLADVKFAYRAATSSYRLRASAGRRRDRQIGSFVQSPAIIIRSRKG